MEFTDIYVNLIRLALIILTIYKACKKDFKLIIPAIIVFLLTFLISLMDIIWDVKIDAIGSIIYYFLQVHLLLVLFGGIYCNEKTECRNLYSV